MEIFGPDFWIRFLDQITRRILLLLELLLAGIIDKILINEGDEVKAGDLLAIIKVVPDEQALNNAEGRLKNAEIVFNNAEIEYFRNKKLFNQSIISEQAFNNIELQYNQAQQNLTNAESDCR